MCVCLCACVCVCALLETLFHHAGGGEEAGELEELVPSPPHPPCHVVRKVHLAPSPAPVQGPWILGGDRSPFIVLPADETSARVRVHVCVCVCVSVCVYTNSGISVIIIIILH